MYLKLSTELTNISSVTQVNHNNDELIVYCSGVAVNIKYNNSSNTYDMKINLNNFSQKFKMDSTHNTESQVISFIEWLSRHYSILE